MRYLIGIDEAGRGPLAGPVAVGAVMVPENFDVRRAFPTVKDSKLLTPQKREEIYQDALERSKAGEIFFCVRFVTHSYIDACGITKAVHRAVARSVSTLAPSPIGVHVFLDGLLHAPIQYEQETIIRGDALIPLISLASVMAKVRRDQLMLKFSKKFPQYGFEFHKGYGTKRHHAALERFGLSEIHRITFCRHLLRARNSV